MNKECNLSLLAYTRIFVTFSDSIDVLFQVMLVGMWSNNKMWFTAHRHQRQPFINILEISYPQTIKLPEPTLQRGQLWTSEPAFIITIGQIERRNQTEGETGIFQREGMLRHEEINAFLSCLKERGVVVPQRWQITSLTLLLFSVESWNERCRRKSRPNEYHHTQNKDVTM